MLICKDCGYTFQEPVTKTEYTGVNSEGFHEKIRYDVCPHCFSDDIDEAHECIICGEWSDYDYCAECRETIVNGLDQLIAQLEKDANYFGTRANRLDIEWAVGDVLDQEF